MAQIRASARESVGKISRWLGLNENMDGDTLLKVGEAADLRNFKITRDGSLQKRPGYETIHMTKTWTGAIRGIWHGNIGGTQRTLFAAGGDIYAYDFATNTAESVLTGGMAFADDATSFFGFGNKVYAQNGTEFLEWDGTMPPSGGFSEPAGYRPLIAVSTVPSGGGTLLESINMLNGLRRVHFSPTGTATEFVLPETGLASVDYVKNNATGSDYVPTTDYTVNLTGGKVIFTSAPTVGANTIEIGYTYPTAYRAQVAAMRFSEIYNGGTDSRVFIYGDGSNRALYSGLDSDGQSRADYWPDLNVIDVGVSNTPITAMIRHYSSLAIFKTDSAYIVNYGQITLESGALTAAFSVTPVNRSIGNAAPGQIQLIENNPRTLFNSAIYEWYMADAVNDERQARRISDRIKNTLASMSLEDAITYDDNERQEYYIIQNGTALVHNYAADVWYKYTSFDFTALIAINGGLYGCTTEGNIVLFSRDCRSDDGAAINCYWQSGSMPFGRDWQNKYSSFLFVTLEPEEFAQINVTVMTNKRSLLPSRLIAYGLATFAHAGFAHFSFGTNRKPQTVRLRIKARKFAYYQLIFISNTNWTTATVLSADIKLRYGNDVK